jgi:hypothetical protein
MTYDNIDCFTRSFLECALWSSSDGEGTPLDAQYDIRHIAAETLKKLIGECQQFQASPVYQSAMEAEAYERESEHSTEDLAGHDFWLTRNGHGAGFWDGDWKEPHASALDALSKSFGQVDLYVGDDGKIYA